ncbi:GET complex subunit get1 [Clavispora lusitaniae]|nr:GET complex subunit get1 [Clavispora lusitaniae]
MFELQPSSIVVLVFCVLAIKVCISLIGKTTIQDRIWYLYTIGASKTGHSKFVALAQKREELVRVNKERRAISAQDEYAKWTKLNRQFDKLNSEVNDLAEATSSEKAQISKLVNLAIAATTTAPIWFSRIWYRKVVLFYLPPKVFPYYIEWVLALPFIVTGGVGLTVWMFALNSVLSSLEFLIKFYLEEPVKKPEAPAASEAQTKQ